MTRHLIKLAPGLRFGRLTTIRKIAPPNNSNTWETLCDCGTVHVVRGRFLASGKVKSCGCLRHDLMVAKATKHGAWGTPEYSIWKGMLTRCRNPNHRAYKHYGGRGIEVRYLSFEEFLHDVGSRPSPDLSIDRINNDGHYQPGNCRWATKREQGSNRRNVRHLTLNGRTQPLAHWSKEYGVSRVTVTRRLANHQIPLSAALARPGELAADKRRRPKVVDITGKRFGRLTAVRLVRKNPTYWECRCDCGSVLPVFAPNLSRGNTRSCGCLRSEMRTKANLERRGTIYQEAVEE